MVVMVRLSTVFAAVLACTAATGCGQFMGDCSGGVYQDGGCVNTQVAVHWTNARATAAARRFDYRPMLQGRMTQVRCRIVARYAAHEAASLCRGVFVSPSKRAGRFVARFALSGIGVMNPDCSTHWKTNPYCNGKGHVITSSDR
jgi:hypothetical protein